MVHPSGAPLAVCCRHLVYAFGPVRAVDDVTFSVAPGEVFSPPRSSAWT
jgi:ABC-type branched-subunit amino acid transport system ATPase component